MILNGSVEYNDTKTASPEELAVLSKAVYLKQIGNEDEKYKNYKDENGNVQLATEQSLDAWRGNQEIKDENLKSKLKNWTVIKDIDDTKGGLRSRVSGMQAVAYMNNKTGEIAIAYRGTDSKLDLTVSDLQIGLKKIPWQLGDAQRFYDAVHDKYPDANIIVTGHSLGGALAQGVAHKNGLSATTYNAPGMQTESGEKSDKIVNYVNMNDFVGSYRKHIGETRYYLPSGKYNKKFAPHSDFYNHDFSNYQPLENNIKWDHNDALALWGYDLKNKESFQKLGLSPIVLEKKLAPALKKVEESGVKTGITGVAHYKAGGKLYSLEADDGKIVKCSYPKGREPREQPAVHKTPKGSSTGGAAPVKNEGSKKSSSSGKGDGDGHWITTKNGNHIFIEDEQPRIYPGLFVYDLVEISENGSCEYLNRDRTAEELLRNSRKGELMKNVDVNKYWNYETTPVSKVGVFEYLGSQISDDLEPNKRYKVYRSAEEIASPEALKTLYLLPITDGHQMLGVGDGFMPAEEKGVHGVLGDSAYIKDGYLYSNMRIFSEHLKDQINNGKRQLSLGYRCEYDRTPGEYNGMPYDMKQINIRYNHLALVDEGRMGADVCVMDSKISFDAKGYVLPIEVDYGLPEVFYSNVSPEVLEVRNDPEMIAYLSRNKGD